MKYLFLFLISLAFITCNKESPEEKFKRLCPYDFVFSTNSRAHLFRIPYEILPNQLTYKKGDTITVKSYFSSDIYDIGTERRFTLDSILLRPIISVLRFFDEDEWERTNDENYIIFDPEYTHAYGNSTFALFNKEDDFYSLEFKILLKKAGRYAMVIGDQHRNNTEQHNELIRSILPHDEVCPNIHPRVCNVIDGDTHMKELEPEFIFIDKEIAFDNYKELGTTIGVYGSGSFAWEYNGAYGFIVEE